MAWGTPDLLFLHVPKTGGTWVLQALIASGVKLEAERPDKDHLTRWECDFRGRFVFAFVREPLAWYASQYHYRRKMRFGDGLFPGDPWLDEPFEEFLRQTVTRNPGLLTGFYNSYVGGPRQPPLDFIGRTESLADDTVRALRLAGVPFDEDRLRGWGRVNESGHEGPLQAPSVELVDAEFDTYRRFYPHVLEL